MLTKKQICLNYERETRKAVGRQLFEMRRHAKKTTLQVCSACGVPTRILEYWEIGKGYFDFHYLSMLARFFDKKIVINFEDIKEEEYRSEQ